VFVESKLSSDISRSTSYFPLVNQAVRNWEAAYCLTRSQASEYVDWDFRYLLICPRKEYEYRATYYACVIGDPEAQIDIHRRILENEYANQVSTERLRDHFDSFRSDVPERVVVVHWCELGEWLIESGFSFGEMIQRIEETCGPQSDECVQALRDRMGRAGIILDEYQQ